jgi:hypothetical protein
MQCTAAKKICLVEKITPEPASSLAVVASRVPRGNSSSQVTLAELVVKGRQKHVNNKQREAKASFNRPSLRQLGLTSKCIIHSAGRVAISPITKSC